MMLGGELMELYRTDLILIKEHGFRMEELDAIMPFERRIYVALVVEYINKKAANQQRN